VTEIGEYLVNASGLAGRLLCFAFAAGLFALELRFRRERSARDHRVPAWSRFRVTMMWSTDRDAEQLAGGY